MMAKWVLLFSLTLSFHALAQQETCLPEAWKKVASLQGSFAFGSKTSERNASVDLWEKIESPVSQAEKAYDAALVWEHCKASRLGFRASGEQHTPFASATMTKLSAGADQEFLSVTSRYAHGFVEEITQLYALDKAKKEFVEVWEGVTLEIPPNGNELKTNLNFISSAHSGVADLKTTGPDSKSQIWIWNASSRRFERQSP